LLTSEKKQNLFSTLTMVQEETPMSTLHLQL